MDTFSVLTLCATFLVLWTNFAECTISSWTLDGGGAINGADVNIDVAIDETSATTTLFTLGATASGTRGTFSISTQPNAGQFEIGSSSGAVSLAASQSLDRETVAMLEIKVEVGDTDDSTTGTATVNITVNDVNEHSPAFHMPSTSVDYTVADDGSSSGDVYTVNATDADATSNTISYSIESGDTNSDFSIDTSTGVISLAKTMNAATTDFYELVVIAEDSATSKQTGTVTIRVVVYDFPACSGAGQTTSLILLTLFNIVFLLL